MKKGDTLQYPNGGLCEQPLWGALKVSEAELEAQTHKLIAIIAHRDRLEQTLKQKQSLWDQTQADLSREIDSAKSEIAQLKDRIAVQGKSLVEVKRASDHLQKSRREQQSKIEELKRDQKQLGEQHLRKQIQQQE